MRYYSTGGNKSKLFGFRAFCGNVPTASIEDLLAEIDSVDSRFPKEQVRFVIQIAIHGDAGGFTVDQIDHRRQCFECFVHITIIAQPGIKVNSSSHQVLIQFDEFVPIRT